MVPLTTVVCDFFLQFSETMNSDSDPTFWFHYHHMPFYYNNFMQITSQTFISNTWIFFGKNCILLNLNYIKIQSRKDLYLCWTSWKSMLPSKSSEIKRNLKHFWNSIYCSVYLFGGGTTCLYLLRPKKLIYSTFYIWESIFVIVMTKWLDYFEIGLYFSVLIHYRDTCQWNILIQ